MVQYLLKHIKHNENNEHNGHFEHFEHYKHFEHFEHFEYFGHLQSGLEISKNIEKHFKWSHLVDFWSCSYPFDQSFLFTWISSGIAVVSMVSVVTAI